MQPRGATKWPELGTTQGFIIAPTSQHLSVRCEVMWQQGGPSQDDTQGQSADQSDCDCLIAELNSDIITIGTTGVGFLK